MPAPGPRIVVITLLTALALTGCGGDPEQTSASTTSTPTVAPPTGGPRILQGGEPGSAAEEVTDGRMAPANEWTHQDVMFMQMMIPHHGQALTMSELAPKRAQDPRVKRLAARILAAQGPEISLMAGWLAERKIEVPRADEDPMKYDHGDHGHTTMTGMLTPQQLAQLARSRGNAFDKLFLTSMIAHHQGAVDMAQETAIGGTDVRVGELRDDVSSSQLAEIGRMRTLLRSL